VHAEPDYELVAKRLSTTRRQRGLNLRDAAREIGVSAPTLSRIERGASRPDILTLDALIGWLGLDRNTIYNSQPRQIESIPDQVEALLRGDERLDAQGVSTLAAIFKAAYNELADRMDMRRRRS